MAAHAAALPEQILAFADGPAHIAADKHHVGSVACLASGFDVLFGEQRPEPVLVIAVRFFNAGGGAAIALMAGRAAELVGIVNLQQLRFRMTDKCLRIFVGLLFALRFMKPA